MRRRALLSASVTGLTATAGCFGPALGFGTDCSRGVDLRLRPTADRQVADAAGDPLDSLSPPERDAVTGGVGVTVWGVSKPFSDVEYLVADGTYYAVATTVESPGRPGRSRRPSSTGTGSTSTSATSRPSNATSSRRPSTTATTSVRPTPRRTRASSERWDGR